MNLFVNYCIYAISILKYLNHFICELGNVQVLRKYIFIIFIPPPPCQKMSVNIIPPT